MHDGTIAVQSQLRIETNCLDQYQPVRHLPEVSNLDSHPSFGHDTDGRDDAPLADVRSDRRGRLRPPDLTPGRCADKGGDTAAGNQEPHWAKDGEARLVLPRLSREPDLARSRKSGWAQVAIRSRAEQASQ